MKLWSVTIPARSWIAPAHSGVKGATRMHQRQTDNLLKVVLVVYPETAELVDCRKMCEPIYLTVTLSIHRMNLFLHLSAQIPGNYWISCRVEPGSVCPKPDGVKPFSVLN